MMNQTIIYAQMLKEGNTVRIPARGNSMRPYIVHRRDIIVTVPAKDVRVGDVVYAEISPDRFVMHRVVRLDGEKVTMRGDGNFATEECTLGAVIGKAVAFVRKGSEEEESVGSARYRTYVWLWMHTLPIRRYLLKAHDILFHSNKKLE